MSKNNRLARLLTHPAVWQASRADSVRPVASTGFSALDRLLHDGGWPRGAFSELLLERVGVGEWRLMAPLLRQQAKQSGYQVLVNPPLLPYSPALKALGIDLSKLVIVTENDPDKAVWAAYQALVSKACSVVMVWLPGLKAYKNEIRKLALGARHGQCWGILLRDQRVAVQPSAATLRMCLSATHPVSHDNIENHAFSDEHKKSSNKHKELSTGEYRIDVLKQAGGWSGQSLTLNLIAAEQQWTALPAVHWPVVDVAHRQKNTPIDSLVDSVVEQRFRRRLLPSVDDFLSTVESASSSSSQPIH